jgi:hypothetical protein
MYVVAGTFQSVWSYVVQHSELWNQFCDEGGDVRGRSATAALQLDVQLKDVGHDAIMRRNSLHINTSVAICTREIRMYEGDSNENRKSAIKI